MDHQDKYFLYHLLHNNRHFLVLRHRKLILRITLFWLEDYRNHDCHLNSKENDEFLQDEISPKKTDNGAQNQKGAEGKSGSPETFFLPYN
jgi:hypothetical protein